MYKCIYRCIYVCLPGAVNLFFKGQYYKCFELLVSFSIYYSFSVLSYDPKVATYDMQTRPVA